MSGGSGGSKPGSPKPGDSPASPPASGSAKITLPQLYPPVRAATPSALIADPQFSASVPPLFGVAKAELGSARQALVSGISLGSAVQERFYSTGPTDLLRIVREVDDRVATLDTDPNHHACLTAPPVALTYALPAGESFTVQLQCLQHFGAPGGSSGWVAFGFDPAATEVAADAGADGGSPSSADAGATAPGRRGDFYLIEGQNNGMGGAYRISPRGDVEGWIAVADRSTPLSSQVLMHLLTSASASTLELEIAGSAVGFCSAHLKTDDHHVFVSGRTNAPPPPGSPMAGQYCDAERNGCFDASALSTDLGVDAAECSRVAPSTFALGVTLDASTDVDAGVANVTPSAIADYFSLEPTGVPAF